MEKADAGILDLGAATAEQRFALMLAERIEALEATNARLEAALSRLDRYDVARNAFLLDGSRLLWDVGDARAPDAAVGGTVRVVGGASVAGESAVPVGDLLARPASFDDVTSQNRADVVRLSLKLPPAIDEAFEVPRFGTTVGELLRALHARLWAPMTPDGYASCAVDLSPYGLGSPERAALEAMTELGVGRARLVDLFRGYCEHVCGRRGVAIHLNGYKDDQFIFVSFRDSFRDGG